MASVRGARRGLLRWSIVAAFAAVAAVPALWSGCAKQTPCQFNSDCPVGYCLNGSCAESCVDSARDCPPGFVCDQNAQCVPGNGMGGSGGSSASSTGPGPATSSSTGGATTTSSTSASSSSSTGPSSTASTTTTTSSTSASSTASSTSGGLMNKHELDLCASDGECASPLVCRTMFAGGSKRCTRTCGSNAVCMQGTVCQTIGSSMYCAFDDTGRTCTTASTCNFGCLVNQQYCTKTCTTGADCPNGYGCMAGVGMSTKSICVKAEAPCDPSDTTACIASSACDVSPQMVVGGCTTLCNTAADCPQRAAGFTPWTCDSGGICRRPADVYGPLQTGATPAQYACDAQSDVVNVCNDGLHIDFTTGMEPSPPAVSCAATTTTSGTATDSCVDSCRYQGGCPFGFECVALGNIGPSRIGLCIPAGFGEVGAPCTQDAQCVFGYCASSLGKCSRDCTLDGVCPNGTTCTLAGGPPVEGQPFRQCQ